MVPSEIAVRQKSALAVGDRITVSGESGTWRLESILPRHSVLARPDPLRPHMQRLIAANIDVVVHVVSVKAPPLRPRLIDRLLESHRKPRQLTVRSKCGQSAIA